MSVFHCCRRGVCRNCGDGNPGGIVRPGRLGYEGNGTEKDLDKAAEWYRKALEAGYEPDEEDQEHLEAVLGDEFKQE